MLHPACEHSPRVTVVRAWKANMADLSHVALLKLPGKLVDRLYALCVSLFREQGMAMAAEGGFLARAFDATTAKGPVIAPWGCGMVQ